MRIIAWSLLLLLAGQAIAAQPTDAAEEDPRAAETRPSSSHSSPQPAFAERQSLRQISAKFRVETQRPRPGLSRFIQDAGTAFGGWLDRALRTYLPSASNFANAPIERFLRIVLSILTILLAAAVLRFAATRWSRRTPTGDPRITPLSTPEHPDPGPRWDRELEKRMADGDAGGAALALWWWLAGRLVGEEAQPSWTSRELIRRAGRIDLMPTIRRLDRVLYGAEKPSIAGVRQLWSELKEVTG